MKPAGHAILAALGVWHGLAGIQNVCDVLASLGVAPELRPYASKNVALARKLTERLHPSLATVGTLIGGAAAIEMFAAISYVRGALLGESPELGFAASLALFAGFFVIDDAFDDYDLGAKHRNIFTLIVASYVAVRTAE